QHHDSCTLYIDYTLIQDPSLTDCEPPRGEDHRSKSSPPDTAPRYGQPEFPCLLLVRRETPPAWIFLTHSVHGGEPYPYRETLRNSALTYGTQSAGPYRDRHRSRSAARYRRNRKARSVYRLTIQGVHRRSRA